MAFLFNRLFSSKEYPFTWNFLRQLRRTFWIVTRHIMPLVFIVVLYLFILYNNPQGIDIVSEVMVNKMYWLWTLLALLSLGTSLWFCAAFLLQMKEVSNDPVFKEDNHSGIHFWLDYLPATLGLLPMFAIFFKSELYQAESFWFLVILFVLILLLPLLIDSFVRRLENTLGSVKWFDNVTMESKSLTSLLYFKGTRVVFWSFVAYSFVLFILSLTSVESGFATTVGPLAVMIFGLSFLSAVLSLVMYFNIPGHRPFLLFFVIVVALLSSLNDNSAIRTLPMQSQRVPLENDFEWWARNLVNKEVTRKTLSSSDTLSVPVIFVATEGGGIRALVWTALVLQKMEKEFPGVYKKIYGISGVSGGGVGATFYVSYLRDQLKSQGGLAPDDPGFTNAIRNDFLSDVLSAFLFQDNLQNILPFAVESFDRTRRLEDAWSHAFSYHTDHDTFEQGFTELYADTSLQLPRLFINGTLAESGQKTIVSYPMIHGAASPKNAPDVLKDEIDLLQVIGKDVPVKTAASLCSRFPYLTSGGLITGLGGKKIGHVIDGGYKENTGLETVWQLLLRLKPIMQKLQNDSLDTAMSQKIKVKFKPIVFFIKNSPPTQVLDSTRVVPSFLHELKIPILGSGNASDRRTPTINALTDNVFKNHYYIDRGIDQKEEPIHCEYLAINLDRSISGGFTLPLGWYFSKNSFNFVEKKTDEIFTKRDTLSYKLKKHLKPVNSWKD